MIFENSDQLSILWAFSSTDVAFEDVYHALKSGSLCPPATG